MNYYLKDTNKEVHMGDSLPILTEVITPFGPAKATVHITVNESNVEKLLSQGIIQKNNKLSYELCIKIVAKQLGVEPEEADVFLKLLLGSGCAAAALQMVLKAASSYLSPLISTVKKLPKVYTISLVDGMIYEIPTSDIKTYDHFAYFVSKTQAKQVKAVFKDLFDTMYGK